MVAVLPASRCSKHLDHVSVVDLHGTPLAAWYNHRAHCDCCSGTEHSLRAKDRIECHWSFKVDFRCVYEHHHGFIARFMRAGEQYSSMFVIDASDCVSLVRHETTA